MFLAAFFGTGLAFRVQAVDFVDHAQCSATGRVRMIGMIQRRVPERHHRIAHEFVDGATGFQNAVGQGRQKLVHQCCERSRVILELLGNRGKAAHIAEEQRQFPCFATQGHAVLVLGQLFNQIGRDVLTKGGSDLPSLPFFAQIVHRRHKDDAKGRCQNRKACINQLPVCREFIPREHAIPDKQHDRPAHQHPRRNCRGQDHHQQAQRKGRHQFDRDRIVWAVEQAIRQDVFQKLRVNFDTGHVHAQRRCPKILEPDGGGTDQNQMPGQPPLRHRTRHQIHRRDIALGRRRRQVGPDGTVGCR